MPKRTIPSPGKYRALDDFLWQDMTGSAAWSAWVHERYGNLRLEGGEFNAAMELHRTLHELEYTNGGAGANVSAARSLNALIERYDIRPAVGPGGTCALVARGGPVCDLLVVALEAMADGTWQRFKRCRDTSCDASFYDVSKSATRKWCSMKRCGSRAKMQRVRRARPRDAAARPSSP